MQVSECVLVRSNAKDLVCSCPLSLSSVPCPYGCPLSPTTCPPPPYMVYSKCYHSLVQLHMDNGGHHDAARLEKAWKVIKEALKAVKGAPQVSLHVQ